MKVLATLASALALAGCVELYTAAHLAVAISNSVAKHLELHQQKREPTPTPTPEGKKVI